MVTISELCILLATICLDYYLFCEEGLTAFPCTFFSKPNFVRQTYSGFFLSLGNPLPPLLSPCPLRQARGFRFCAGAACESFIRGRGQPSASIPPDRQAYGEGVLLRATPRVLVAELPVPAPDHHDAGHDWRPVHPPQDGPRPGAAQGDAGHDSGRRQQRSALGAGPAATAATAPPMNPVITASVTETGRQGQCCHTSRHMAFLPLGREAKPSAPPTPAPRFQPRTFLAGTAAAVLREGHAPPRTPPQSRPPFRTTTRWHSGAPRAALLHPRPLLRPF